MQRLNAALGVHDKIRGAVRHLVVGTDVMTLLGHSVHVGHYTRPAVEDPMGVILGGTVVPELGDNQGTAADDCEGLAALG